MNSHIKQDFLWSEQHSKTFTQAKELVSKALCLRYFNVNAPVILQVDASERGLGAALLQPASDTTGSCSTEWQPVAFSSSSLSPTEQRYVQIEKETLAIVHAFHKFDQLLFGKSDVTVHSDHQPLETIFKRPLASARRRLQSMMLALQATPSMLNIARVPHYTLQTLFLELLYPPHHISKCMMSWSTESSLSPTLLTSLASTMLLFGTSELWLLQTLSRTFSAL